MSLTAWEEALSADRPVVIDAHTDPEVPPLPPHITMKEAQHLLKSILHGDPNRKHLIGQSFKDVVEELFAASLKIQPKIIMKTEQILAGKKVAILATDGFEQDELLSPLEALKDAGAEAQVVSPSEESKIKGVETHRLGKKGKSGRAA